MLVGYLSESGAPEMEQLQKTVGLVASACQATDLGSFIPTREQLEAPMENQVVNAAEPVRQSTDWRSVQAITREDAQLMLEKVKQYFVQYEPSHPAPLMIERVQRVIEMNFMDIIRDLAPDGVNQLENILGRRD